MEQGVNAGDLTESSVKLMKVKVERMCDGEEMNKKIRFSCAELWIISKALIIDEDTSL